MVNKMAPTRIIYIPFDHLNVRYGALKEANKEEDLVLFVESQRMVDPKKFHPERLFFLISSARHFSKELKDSGFNIIYRKAPTTLEGIEAVRAEYGGVPIFAAKQSSFRLQRDLELIGANFTPNDLFLTPRELFEEWSEGQKSFLMENFYRKQRLRLNILMEGNKPVGGQWNLPVAEIPNI
jgi:deoxyribodipyrimidine photolyase-related protein